MAQASSPCVTGHEQAVRNLEFSTSSIKRNYAQRVHARNEAREAEVAVLAHPNQLFIKVHRHSIETITLVRSEEEQRGLVNGIGEQLASDRWDGMIRITNGT